MVGLAACARAYPNGLGDVRLAFFGIGVTPVRARAAEDALTGASGMNSAEQAIAALQQELDPTQDVQATGTLKKHLAGVLLKRVLGQLLEPRP
jgi:carbon-monoxide dehydrogenase medium subunit